MDMNEIRDMLSAWRSLSSEEKYQYNSSILVDDVIASMIFEGEPMSDDWIESARKRKFSST